MGAGTTSVSAADMSTACPVHADAASDVGTSKKIINGQIKLKGDSPLAGFTKTGLKFEDGSELQADVVLFATG